MMIFSGTSLSLSRSLSGSSHHLHWEPRIRAKMNEMQVCVWIEWNFFSFAFFFVFLLLSRSEWLHTLVQHWRKENRSEGRKGEEKKNCWWLASRWKYLGAHSISIFSNVTTLYRCLHYRWGLVLYCSCLFESIIILYESKRNWNRN